MDLTSKKCKITLQDEMFIALHATQDKAIFIVDSTHFPLVVTGVPAPMKEEDVKIFFEEHHKISLRAQENKTKLIVVSLLDNHNSTANGRSLTRKYVALSNPEPTQVIHSLAVITPNSLARGALTALQWMFDLPIKMYPVKDIADMTKYIEKEFIHLKSPVHSHLNTYLERMHEKMSTTTTKYPKLDSTFRPKSRLLK